MTTIESEGLADLLACPACHARLLATVDSLVCTGTECRLRFPIREGIPVLLVEEAELLDEVDWQAAVGDCAEDSVADHLASPTETGASEEDES